MNRIWMLMALVAAASVMAALPTEAMAENAERAGCNCIFCQAKETSRQALPWLKWGADARLREISSPNMLGDQEDRHFQRYRFRVWATATPVKDVDVNLRLVWEPRHFCQPERKAKLRNAAYIDSWTLNEAIIDRANVKWSNIAGLPLSVTVGRQDIILGNGWLVLDGTPLDDSRTIFFDAIRGTLKLEDLKTRVDLIYICQQADSDAHISPFCDKDYHNIEQDERGVIVYVTNTSLPNTQIEGFFIYKHDEAVLGQRVGDGTAPWQAGTDADIYTFGGRVAGGLGEAWKYRVEGAGQFGWKNQQNLCAMGFNSQLAYHLNDQLKNNFRVEYEYLSGDKPGTEGTNEQFDPLWGRWARWSELLAYGVGLENRPGEQTNLHRVGVGWSCTPHAKLQFDFDYNLIFADKNSFRERAYFSDTGCFKGQLAAFLLKYKFSQHISGHALAELFCPGDYYSKANDDFAAFLRYEIVFTW